MLAMFPAVVLSHVWAASIPVPAMSRDGNRLLRSSRRRRPTPDGTGRSACRPWSGTAVSPAGRRPAGCRCRRCSRRWRRRGSAETTTLAVPPLRRVKEGLLQAGLEVDVLGRVARRLRVGEVVGGGLLLLATPSTAYCSTSTIPSIALDLPGTLRASTGRVPEETLVEPVLGVMTPSHPWSVARHPSTAGRPRFRLKSSQLPTLYASESSWRSSWSGEPWPPDPAIGGRGQRDSGDRRRG